MIRLSHLRVGLGHISWYSLVLNVPGLDRVLETRVDAGCLVHWDETRLSLDIMNGRLVGLVG